MSDHLEQPDHAGLAGDRARVRAPADDGWRQVDLDPAARATSSDPGARATSFDPGARATSWPGDLIGAGPSGPAAQVWAEDDTEDEGEDPAAARERRQRGGTPAGRAPAALRDRLPAALRGVVWDPATRGALALALLALVAAAVAAVFAWQSRPVALGPVAADGRGAAAAAGRCPSPGAAGSPAALAGAAGAPTAGAPSSPSPPPDAVVDVAGKVRQPGVVRLPAGSRVIDAIERAGGVLPGTDTTGLALARVLVDGEQILVDGRPGPAPPPAPAAAGQGTEGSAGGPGGGPVRLNTATAEQLDSLPGIGPVLAERIVAWRAEHGGFTSPEQLGEVPGVGDARLAQLLPLVTL